MAPICRRGDLQRAADRFDPATSAILIDEGVHFLNWRLNSAWAKYALANFDRRHLSKIPTPNPHLSRELRVVDQLQGDQRLDAFHALAWLVHSTPSWPR
jgi:hypothetical protein